MLNSKGNLAFTLLPVVALALCGMALFSFITLNNDIQKPSQEIASMVSDLSINQQYIESSAKLIVKDALTDGLTMNAVKESAQRHDMHLEGEGNFFIKIEQGEFKIAKSGNFIIFEVDGVFIQSRQGDSLGQRNLDLVLEADTSGEFIKFINK